MVKTVSRVIGRSGGLPGKSQTVADDLSLAVDVRYSEVGELGDSQAGGIDGHQDGAVFEITGSFEDCCDFSGTQDYRQFFLVPRVRNMFNHPVAVEDMAIEKAQSAYGLIEHRPRDPFSLNQKQLVLPDVFGSEPIRGEFEMLSEFCDAADVNLDGVGRVVP
jgi:hypothetical protein